MARSNYKGKRNTDSTSTGTRGNTSKKRTGNKSWSKDKDEREVRTGGKKIVDAINDISWYAHNPQLLKDGSSVAFNQMLGLPMNFGAWGPDIPGFIQDKLPGLLVLKTVPSFGSSHIAGTNDVDPNSAINVAAQNLYSYVRHANSGHSNYDPCDLMIYVAAMDQAYSFHAELVRAYGIMRFYSGYNRYLGKYLTEALGFDYDDLLPNLAGFRYLINSFAAKLATFAVPAIFPLFERHRWIYSNVYMDRPSTRAQLYAFVPEYRGLYNEPHEASSVTYKAGVRVKTNALGYKKTLSDISTLISEVITPLLNSEDIGIMSGDVLKAYGADKCYQINGMPEDYVLGPVYVEEVLRQIHNTITVGVPFFPVQDGSSMMLWQDGTNPLIHTWDKTNQYVYINLVGTNTVPSDAIKNMGFLTGPKLLDTNIDSPSPEDVMIMSRLTNVPVDFQPSSTISQQVTNKNIAANDGWFLNGETRFSSLAADAIMHFVVYSGELVDNGDPEYTILFSHSLVVDDGSNIYNYATYRQAVCDISKFNWHPIIYEVHALAAFVKGSAPVPIKASDLHLRLYGDLDNCVPVPADVINRMHDVALLSMLNVPSAVLTKGV